MSCTTKASPIRSIDSQFDMRYSGQSYELTVPLTIAGQHGTSAGGSRRLPQRPRAALWLRHAGRARRGRHPARARQRSRRQARAAQQSARIARCRRGTTGRQTSLVRGRADRSGRDSTTVHPQTVPCYDRTKLRPGNRFTGPALLLQFDTTTVITPGWSARVDEFSNIWLDKVTG